MDRIGDLRLFLRILDLGSITAAARSMNLSVASASQRLRALEHSLGVRLFQRSTRKLRVTPEGAELAARGRGLLEELEALASGLGRSATEVTGTLRVTMPAGFGREHVSPLLPAFLARHRHLRLAVDLSDSFQDLVAEGVDVAIRVGRLEDSSLVVRRLASNRRVLCASPEYLRRYGVPTTPGDLQRHECLIMSGGKGTRDTWTLISPSGETIRVRVRGRLVSNVGEVLRDAAIAGFGISLHSMWQVSEDLRAGRLQVVLPEYRLEDGAIYAVMPPRRTTLPRVRAFVDFLVEQLGETPPWERGSLPPGRADSPSALRARR